MVCQLGARERRLSNSGTLMGESFTNGVIQRFERDSKRDTTPSNSLKAIM